MCACALATRPLLAHAFVQEVLTASSPEDSGGQRLGQGPGLKLKPISAVILTDAANVLFISGKMKCEQLQ